MHEAIAEATITPKYKVVTNDVSIAAGSLEVLAALFPGRARPLRTPTLGSEDFGAVLSRVPGAMIFLGAATAGSETWNHSPDVVFNESVLADGAIALAELAMRHCRTEE